MISDFAKNYLIDFYKDDMRYGEHADRVIGELDNLSIGYLLGMAEAIDRLDINMKPVDFQDMPTLSKIIDEFKISILHDSVKRLKDVAYRLFEEIVGDEENIGAVNPGICQKKADVDYFLNLAEDGDIIEFQDGKLARFTVYEDEQYFAFDDRVEKVGTDSEAYKHIYAIKRPIYYKYSKTSKPAMPSEQE
jgi:hypothetical protein